MERRAANEAARDGWPVQPGVSRAELAGFDRSAAARRIARLEGDAALMLRLSVEGFEGRAWEKVSDALVEYGWQVMRAWIVTGEVFVKLREKGQRSYPPPANGIPRDEALDLAQITVADAIIHFRDHVLKRGAWDPSKGANLTTYFIGNCLRYQFPNVYRNWLAERRRAAEQGKLAEFGERVTSGEAADPADMVTAAEADTAAVERLLKPVDDPTNRAIVMLKAEGYDLDEIAELLGIEYAAVESRIYRTRKKLGRTTKESA